MRCPFCQDTENKVIDSRESHEGSVIRRRRECLECKRRFTTYERVEELYPLIVKKDGRREAFDRDKIVNGLQKACEKRPVSVDQIEQTVGTIERMLQGMGEKEVPSSVIGEEVMRQLRDAGRGGLRALRLGVPELPRHRRVHERAARARGPVQGGPPQASVRQGWPAVMRLLTRARLKASRAPRAKRAADFDRAVAEFFMRIALEEATKGLGRTTPNPAVGAVLVKGGRIIARGFTQPAGQAHAEVMALRAAGPRARGADLYTTLEPCNHYGRTPPCTLAILEAGVRRVICASSDPNPKVNGKGIARLRRHGVEVLTGVLEEEADRLNRAFFKAIDTGLPYVTLKAAVTLDGKLATATGDSRWVTGEPARAWVHQLRNRVDVVLVGSNTVRLDDPQLTTRLPGGGGRDPVRVVVDSHLSLKPKHTLFTQRSTAKTVLATLEDPAGRKARRFTEQGVEVWQVREKRGRVDLKALLARIAQQGSNHVLVEGGAGMYGSFLRERLADELALFLAPKLVGSQGLSWSGELGVKMMSDALALKNVTFERLGEDLLLQARL